MERAVVVADPAGDTPAEPDTGLPEATAPDAPRPAA
jgi:hypothetical protein